MEDLLKHANEATLIVMKNIYFSDHYAVKFSDQIEVK